MLETLTRHWWILAVRGALAVLFGLLALIWPGITVLALVLLFGAYALVDGVMALYTALFDRGRRGGRAGWLVLEGVAGVLAAIGAVVWPGITALALLYLIAAWALVTGVAEILADVPAPAAPGRHRGGPCHARPGPELCPRARGWGPA